MTSVTSAQPSDMRVRTRTTASRPTKMIRSGCVDIAPRKMMSI